MEAGLYVVGTPIGNLKDITQRALDALRDADIILAEDTRHTRKLLNAYEIKTPTKSCHKFNEAARCDLVQRLIEQEGQAVAMVTDSGMPGISDPGSRIAAHCLAAGLLVSVMPGPSSLTTAAALSGLCSRDFYFEGFLPHKSGARRRRLEALGAMGMAFVLFESPYRMPRLLGELNEAVPTRRLFIARELTKKFEQLYTGVVSELHEELGERTWKGECVAVVGAQDGKA